MLYISTVSSRTNELPLGNRSLPIDFPVKPKIYQCFFENCQVPVVGEAEPQTGGRPDTAVYWSQNESWSFSTEGYGSYYGSGDYGPPLEYTDVMIPAG